MHLCVRYGDGFQMAYTQTGGGAPARLSTWRTSQDPTSPSCNNNGYVPPWGWSRHCSGRRVLFFHDVAAIYSATLLMLQPTALVIQYRLGGLLSAEVTCHSNSK
eukprot:TRINITY_DN1847_c0_g1_i12.p3 TRINITY_DN1847_c0_g1~~TRINITY_DN1847_c0_g1_i12.p3  ORF type:complete len:104 (+),score=7.91 TRINITY_DN1847_c0_g1_i12:974-1285(+)